MKNTEKEIRFQAWLALMHNLDHVGVIPEDVSIRFVKGFDGAPRDLELTARYGEGARRLANRVLLTREMLDTPGMSKVLQHTWKGIIRGLSAHVG